MDKRSFLFELNTIFLLKSRIWQLVSISLVIAILALGMSSGFALAQTMTGEANIEEIDAYVQGEMKRAAIPGLAYGIVYRDQVVHMQAFGVADTHGRPVTPQTPFAIGSIAKTFAALAVQQLVNDGKVELDAPVQRYIPWFQLADPGAAASITIRQLISHTSGLSWADGNRAALADKGLTIEEAVRRMDKLQPNRPVGSSVEYCNLNYLVLGEVVQILSGQSYQEYIQTNVFRPLNMTHSYLSVAEALQNGLSTGFHIWYGFPIPMQTDMPEIAAPYGFMISSVEDLSHYLVAYLNRGTYQGSSVLLPAASIVQKKPANWYDTHWNEYFGSNARYSEYQSGGTFSFSSVVKIMGEESQGSYGIVVLLNTRPDFVVETVNAVTITEGITSLLLHGTVEKTSAWGSVQWYIGWGVIDVLLLILVSLTLFELFTIRRWAFAIIRSEEGPRPGFYVRTSIDLVAGVFALVALPAWQGLSWTDLLKPFCELCPILLSTGIILISVAAVKILLTILKGRRLSKTALASMLFLSLIISSVNSISVQASPLFQFASYGEIDSYVQKEMEAASIPGLAYAIVKGDKIVHLQAFGIADTSGRPITPQTPFLIGSVGKVITSLAIQKLVSAGKVELDVPVQRYIPWFRLADEGAASQITIRHLLTHTSGLSTGDGANLKYYQADPYTNEEIVRGLDQIHLDRPVGSSQEYSNLNFLILGQVIEQVTGQSYEEYVQKNIFIPLEMQHSYMNLETAQQAGMAKGNRILFGFLTPLELPYPSWLMATGYHISSAEDMAHLLIAHLNQGRYGDISVLSQDRQSAQTVASKTSPYDIHWIGIDAMPKNYTDAQSGTTLDYSSCYYILPNYHAGVVVLTNANTAEVTPTKNAQTIAFDILEMSTGFSSRSNALSIKTAYVGIDLLLLCGALLPVTQILRIRVWRKKMANQPGKTWISFLPTVLIDFTLPVLLILGIPALISTKSVPGLPYWSGWTFITYILPDIGYSLLGIAGLLILTGIVKLFWFIQSEDRSKVSHGS